MKNITETRHIIQKSSCLYCCLKSRCLAEGLDLNELKPFCDAIIHTRSYQRGQHIFYLGDSFRNLYIIKSGSVKIYLSTENDGAEQINEFVFPGGIAGLEAIGNGRYLSSAVALETTTVCILPYSRFSALCSKLPHLQEHFLQLVSNKIASANRLLLLINQRTARERLAAFLLDYCSRMNIFSTPYQEINLSMSRYDIANYLGLTAETVSRQFTRLDKEGILKVDKHYISILDMKRLSLIAKSTDSYPNTVTIH